MEAEQKEKTGGGESSVGEGRRILSRSGLMPTWSVTPPHKHVQNQMLHPTLWYVSERHINRPFYWQLFSFLGGVTVVCAFFANGPWLKHFQALAMQQWAASHGSDHLYSNFFSRPQKYIQGFFFTGCTEQRFGCIAPAAALAASSGLLPLLQTSLHDPRPPLSAAEAFLSSDTLEG